MRKLILRLRINKPVVLKRKHRCSLWRLRCFCHFFFKIGDICWVELVLGLDLSGDEWEQENRNNRHEHLKRPQPVVTRKNWNFANISLIFLEILICKIWPDGRKFIVALLSTRRLAGSAQKLFLFVIENLLADCQRWQKSEKEEQSAPSVPKWSRIFQDFIDDIFQRL